MGLFISWNKTACFLSVLFVKEEGSGLWFLTLKAPLLSEDLTFFQGFLPPPLLKMHTLIPAGHLECCIIYTPSCLLLKAVLVVRLPASFLKQAVRLAGSGLILLFNVSIMVTETDQPTGCRSCELISGRLLGSNVQRLGGGGEADISYVYRIVTGAE